MNYNPQVPISLSKDYDHMFALILRPDEADIADEDKLMTSPTVWRKCNPHIGIITQESFYEQEARNARMNEDSRKEFLVKLLNLFQSNKRRDWVKPDTIRHLQTNVRITDLSTDDGWVCFVGIDLSAVGDDLYAVSYLAVNIYDGRFFADCHAWTTTEACASSPMRSFYEQIAANGWITIVDGGVFKSALFLDQLVTISEKMDLVAFGYDAYGSRNVINDLSAWLSARGVEPKTCVMPVKQSYATYNPLVLEFDQLVKNDPPLISFSRSPLWVWEFSNCVLDESSDGYGNLKPVKSSATGKVDNVQCLLTALHLFDKFDGKSIDV